MKYSNSFTYDLTIGEEAETWISEIFNGKIKAEVKTDFIAYKTGNIYIEVFSRGKPSGISTSTAQYWIFKLDKIEITLIVGIDKLKAIVKKYHKLNGYKLGGDNDTSKGVLIPIKSLFE
jgi:hypothetical protein